MVETGAELDGGNVVVLSDHIERRAVVISNLLIGDFAMEVHVMRQDKQLLDIVARNLRIQIFRIVPAHINHFADDGADEEALIEKLHLDLGGGIGTKFDADQGAFAADFGDFLCLLGNSIELLKEELADLSYVAEQIFRFDLFYDGKSCGTKIPQPRHSCVM